MDLPVEDGMRDGAADHRRGDVVEERRQHEHRGEQHEAALPVVGQPARQHRRHLAVLEGPGQQGEAEQQEQQVGQRHPLVLEMNGEAGQARTRSRTARSTISIDRDDHGADDRDAQGVLVEHRDAGEHAGEEDEFDGHRSDHGNGY